MNKKNIFTTNIINLRDMFFFIKFFIMTFSYFYFTAIIIVFNLFTLHFSILKSLLL